MTVSKSLERVADHATNIAEEVVYLCEARDIRHEANKPCHEPLLSPPRQGLSARPQYRPDSKRPLTREGRKNHAPGRRAASANWICPST